MNGSEGYSVVSERVNFETMYTDVAVKPVSPLETSNESGATTLKEHDYIGLSEVSSATSSSNKQPEGGRGGEALDLNESATVLRLGPPAVPKPEFPKPVVRASQRNNPILEEFREAQAMKAATQHATPQHYQQQGEELKSDRGAVYHPNGAYPAPCYRHHTPYNVFPGVKNNGVKRGFSETVGMHHHLTAREAHCDVSGTEQQPDVKAKLQQGNTMWMSNNSSHNLYNVQRRTLVQDAGDSSTKKHSLKNEAMASSDQPSSPAQNQTVGWPPVRSFLRNNNPVKPAPPPPTPTTAVQGKDTPPSTNSKSCFVKIYMDGVPFGRKVDLRTNNKYEKLYSALEEMFQQFISGHYSGNQTSSSTNSHFVSSSSSRKLNFLDGSEYVLIYEDHEGDFMLVGDVPWELFVNTVKRLRIMKGSEDVNLAPKSADPVKSQPAVG